MTQAGGEEADGGGTIALPASSAEGNTSAETSSVNTLDTSVYLNILSLRHTIIWSGNSKELWFGVTSGVTFALVWSF